MWPSSVPGPKGPSQKGRTRVTTTSPGVVSTRIMRYFPLPRGPLPRFVAVILLFLVPVIALGHGGGHGGGGHGGGARVGGGGVQGGGGSFHAGGALYGGGMRMPPSHSVAPSRSFAPSHSVAP